MMVEEIYSEYKTGKRMGQGVAARLTFRVKRLNHRSGNYDG